jgi:erythromycin esterase-like protein
LTVPFSSSAVEAARAISVPIIGSDHDYDALIDLATNARYVLLGEASHGTHEFYEERMRITRRLMTDLDFTVMAIEGDWPEAYQANRFIRAGGSSAEQTLRSAFTQYPPWMWANRPMADLVSWLRQLNRGLHQTPHMLFGLDVYSPYRSLGLAAELLARINLTAAERADREIAGLGNLAQRDSTAFGGEADPALLSTIDALQVLLDATSGEATGRIDDPRFLIEHSLEMARAGARYAPLFGGDGPDGWNVRDTAMTDALDRLMAHLGPSTRVVIWQHNAHVGDFRATGDSDGRVNLGQLVRERHPGESIAVGFGTYEGTVTAGPAWGEAPQTMPVPPARADSYDALFHQAGLERSLLLLHSLAEHPAAAAFPGEADQRALGAVNDPTQDAKGYTPTRLAQRYDAYIHIDRTSAVEPLG